MGCNCKQEDRIAAYNAKREKMLGIKKTWRDYIDILVSAFLSVILRLIGVVFVLFVCPFFLVFVAINILIGKPSSFALPKEVVDLIKKNVNKEKDVE